MTVTVEASPADVGLDAGRLARLDEHFGRYVDDGRLAGYQLLVARRGKVAHLSTGGHRDREAGLAYEPDTLVRIYSMTKPITSVALMQLFEQGAFQLTDPLRDYLPAAGGQPFGSLPSDADFLDADFDPTQLEGQAEIRALRFRFALDTLALAMASVLAHEIGHSLGLVKEGLPPQGLLAGVNAALALGFGPGDREPLILRRDQAYGPA